MNIRKSIVLALPLSLGLIASAQAAPPKKAPAPLVLTDITGDANLANNQGFSTLPGGVSNPVPSGTKTEPASASQYDIKSLTVAATGSMVTRTVRRKKVKSFNCTGYTVTLEMVGAPSTTGSLYRVKGSTPAHGTYWLEFANDLDASRTTLRYTDDSSLTGTSSIPIAQAVIKENKVIFTVTGANIKATGEALGKTVISGWGADVRNNFKVMGGGPTVPMWDELAIDAAKAWKVCPA